MVKMLGKNIQSDFDAYVVYNDKAILAFCKAQFNVFQTKKQIALILISIFMILLGGSGVAGYAAAAVLIPSGCWLLMSLNSFPKSDARKIAASFGGCFPESGYRIGKDGISIDAGGKKNHLDYADLIRLVEDDDYFMFFASPQVGYLIDKTSIPTEELGRFSAYIQEATGLGWLRSRAWYSVSLPFILDICRNFRKKTETKR